jgi:hypothetical protein
MLGLLSGTAGEENWTANGQSSAFESEMIRAACFGRMRCGTVGEMSIRSVDDGGGDYGSGGRPVCVSELGAELIDIVEAKEMSKSDERYVLASSQLTAIEGELGWRSTGLWRLRGDEDDIASALRLR